jgi:hypothetical protein
LGYPYLLDSLFILARKLQSSRLEVATMEKHKERGENESD